MAPGNGRDAQNRVFFQALGRAPTINQTPDARIVSENTWLSRIPGLSWTDAEISPVSRSTPIDAFTISEALVSHSIAGDLGRWRDVITLAGNFPEASPLKDSAVTYTSAFGPSHFETDCGFKIRGAEVAHALCKDATVEILDTARSIVRVGRMSQPRALVLLELRNGTGVLVPAIPDFIAELTFESNELVNVSYEPSDRSPRWDEYAKRQDELRTLRASIAASAGVGVFRVSGDDALGLARRMQIAKGVDPSMALYAAYAYHDLQRRDLIRQMDRYLHADLGFVFFDLALLTGDRPSGPADGRGVAPPFPMLSQGWSLLSAFRVKLPSSLQQLQQHLLPSLWTMFDQGGVAKLTSAIHSGELR